MEREAARVLVVGARGLPADLCVDWSDPVPNASDFDAAIVLVPTVELAQSLPAGTLSGFRSRFRQLLDSGGDLYVLAIPRDSWQREGRSVIYGHEDNYDWCPVWVTIESESGTTFSQLDPVAEWFFNRMQRWEMTSHSRIARSDPALAKVLPFGLKATVRTKSVWPTRDAWYRPVAGSQSRTSPGLSRCAEART